MGSTPPTVTWRDRPEDHDFPAAASYLHLLARGDDVDALVGRLRSGVLRHFKAKDILRAARLPLLDTDNPHVASDLAKIGRGGPLTPILLVRGSLKDDRRLQVADGYHRVCACYHTDENIDIPCILAEL